MLPILPVIVPRFRSRRGNSLRPVNRIKHVVDIQGATTAGTQVLNILIDTIDTPTLANVSGVETGSTVNAIYLKVEINATSSAALSNAYMMVFKNPGSNLTFPNANAVGGVDNKKYVIHQEMIMMQQVTNSNPRTLFNGVIVIPRGYRRNAPDDQLLLAVFSPGVNINFCIQCHYKEFR